MSNKLSWQRTLVWVTIYSIAMAYLESVVVVYLRIKYYPYGFDFPLNPVDKSIILTEIGREAATILMLIAVAIIAGNSNQQKFAYFLYSFALWDIFYYVFLKILVNWPESLLTWDILFMIPVTWVGPVITPVILAFLMIWLSLLIIIREEKRKTIRIGILSWIFLIVGSVVVIISYTWDYTSYLLQYFSFSEIFSSTDNPALNDIAYKYIPREFNWWIFILGTVIILAGILLVIRFKKKKS